MCLLSKVFTQFAEGYKVPPEKTQSHLKSQFPPEITLVKSQKKLSDLPKTKFLVHSHLKYILQKVFKITEVKLTTSRLSLIGIYLYQSANRVINSNLLMHSHRGSLSIDLMIKTILMRMYKQIRKLHLTKITSKIYATT